MTTITKIEQKFKDGKPSGFAVDLADGTKGYLVEKESDKDLKDGEQVNYTAVTPEGKTYKKLTIKRASSSSAPEQQSLVNSKGVLSNNILPLKAEANNAALEYTVNLFIAGKIKYEQMKETHAELIGILYSAIDEING